MIFNEKGLAMPLAIMVMVVLILLGTTLLFYSTLEVTHVNQIEKNMQAHYLARSGAKTMAAWLYNNLESPELEDILNIWSDPLEFDTGSFMVRIRRDDPDKDIFTIESKGIVGPGSSESFTDEIGVKVDFTPDGGGGNGGGTPIEPPELEDDDVSVGDLFPGYEGSDYEDLLEDDVWEDAYEDLEWIGSNGQLEVGAGNDEDDILEAIVFPQEIDVDHQRDQTDIHFYASFMLFANPDVSLYVKNGNALRLHADIIVFLGEVKLDQSGINYAELTFHVLPDSDFGRVYFYKGVKAIGSPAHQVGGDADGIIIQPGVYCFGDTVVIRSDQQVDDHDELLTELGLRKCLTGDIESNMTWEIIVD